MISGPRTPAVGRFSKVRRFLRLRPTLQDFSPPTSTESLPPIIHATPTDYFPYVLPLARGLSQLVSGQGQHDRTTGLIARTADDEGHDVSPHRPTSAVISANVNRSNSPD